MKTITKRIVLILSLLAYTVILFAGGAGPLPGDPGVGVPLDGAILLSLLAGAGITAAIFSKKKKK